MISLSDALVIAGALLLIGCSAESSKNHLEGPGAEAVSSLFGQENDKSNILVTGIFVVKPMDLTGSSGYLCQDWGVDLNQVGRYFPDELQTLCVDLMSDENVLAMPNESCVVVSGLFRPYVDWDDFSCIEEDQEECRSGGVIPVSGMASTHGVVQMQSAVLCSET